MGDPYEREAMLAQTQRQFPEMFPDLQRHYQVALDQRPLPEQKPPRRAGGP